MTDHRTTGLTTVELFCGIGGFRVAAEELGLKTIWANDLNTVAAKVYKARYGVSNFHEGDINQLANEVPIHDILTAGFPCQPFSAAGKKEGIRDPRGTLFQAIVDVVKRTQPQHFVLENVRRLLSMEDGSHFATVLEALSRLNYFVEWRVLNAKDFALAQNRERVLIIGTRLPQNWDNDFDPTDYVRLANGADLLSGPRGLPTLLRQPSTWRSLIRHGSKFPFWGVALNGNFLACTLTEFSEARSPVLIREILENTTSPEYDYTEQTISRLHKNDTVDKFVNGVEIISNQAGGARMGYTIFGVAGIAPTLTASTSRHYERYKIGDKYRRLTPIEYARLQGFSDDHCNSVSGYDQYMLYGNALPPPIAKWVLLSLLSTGTNPTPMPITTQPELFHA